MNYFIVQGDTIPTNCVRNAACKLTVKRFCDGRTLRLWPINIKQTKSA